MSKFTEGSVVRSICHRNPDLSFRVLGYNSVGWTWIERRDWNREYYDPMRGYVASGKDPIINLIHESYLEFHPDYLGEIDKDSKYFTPKIRVKGPLKVKTDVLQTSTEQN
jgi:hypothetical protein